MRKLLINTLLVTLFALVGVVCLLGVPREDASTWSFVLVLISTRVAGLVCVAIAVRLYKKTYRCWEDIEE